MIWNSSAHKLYIANIARIKEERKLMAATATERAIVQKKKEENPKPQK